MQDIATRKRHTARPGNFNLSNDKKSPPNSGTIFTNMTIISVVMSSAAKVELGAKHLHAKETIYLRQILFKMGPP
jgi:hypothetical protein